MADRWDPILPTRNAYSGSSEPQRGGISKTFCVSVADGGPVNDRQSLIQSSSTQMSRPTGCCSQTRSLLTNKTSKKQDRNVTRALPSVDVVLAGTVVLCWYRGNVNSNHENNMPLSTPLYGRNSEDKGRNEGNCTIRSSSSSSSRSIV